jgi:hypothetical protein
MNDFLYRLRAHTGGLICIKSDLHWYDGLGRSNPINDVIGLVLEVHRRVPYGGTTAATTTLSKSDAVASLLQVSGNQRWIWVTAEDVELL